MYGCDTGCCRHTIQLGKESRFSFSHKYDNTKSDVEWAKEMIIQSFGKAHCADIDWDTAEIELSDD